jgi:hypothetical protein
MTTGQQLLRSASLNHLADSVTKVDRPVARRQWERRGENPTSAVSLGDFAAQVGVRIVKLAPYATPMMRYDLRAALEFVLVYVEKFEGAIVATAQRQIKDLPPVTDVQFEVALADLKPKRKSAATKPRRNPRDAFVGGRGLPTSRKRLTAGRAT